MIFSGEIITSRNNSQVKWAAELLTKKGREKHRSFIAEGEKLAFEAISAGVTVSHIFLLEENASKFLERLADPSYEKKLKETKIYVLGKSAFEKISTEKAPEGIITVIKYLDFFREIDIIYKEDFFLQPTEKAIILNSVRDPGNLGAIIRSATAFGVDNIIMTSDSVELYNPKTVRSAMGSLFRIKTTVVSDALSLIRAIKENGRRVLAAELTKDAVDIKSVGLSDSDVIIIGNEGHGIDPSLSKCATKSVYIPISERTESLNASVAASILLWEQFG